MKPMMALALKHEDINRKIGSNWIMEEKFDGMRLLLHFPGGKLLRALTRSERDVLPQVPNEWVQQTEEDIHDFWHWTGFEWLDCEFGYVPFYIAEHGTKVRAGGIDFNKTMRVMGSGPDEAQRKADEILCAEDDLPVAHIFDIPDCNLPLWSRKANLEPFDRGHGNHPFHSHLLAPVMWARDWREDWYERIVTQGGEGAMLKNPNSLYLPGKRSANTWYKVKKFDTFDAYVIGFDQGQGKYSDLIGAIVCRTQDGMTVRCSGMTDDERIKITVRQERIIREQWVLEVKYFGLTAGTPRHPQFLRWRKDKPASECWWEQPKEQQT